MADTKRTKPGKAKPEQVAATPSSAKPPPKASTAKEDSAPAVAKPAAISSKSATSRAKAATAEFVLPPTPEPAVTRGVEEETVKVKPGTKARPGTKKPASDAARSSGATGKPTEPRDAEETYRMIAEAAYYLAEKRNFAPGWEQEDWETAKKDVMARLEKRKA